VYARAQEAVGCKVRLVWLGLILAGYFQGQHASLADSIQSDNAKLLYEEPRTLTGAIYAAGSSGQLLFKFKRQATRSGATLNVLREYTYPDGKLAARERVVYEGDNLVSYQLEELQTGAGGSAKVRRDPKKQAKGTLEFEYRKEAGGANRPKVSDEQLKPSTLMNDMVGPFLLSHWDALIAREKVKCRYIVIPRAETVGFTFTKESELTWKGREVIVVKMEPTSPIISALVDPLFFTIEKASPHRVLQYVGRTTPKIKAGGKWKDLDAVTVFDWK
jgi:hypothetical protein